MPIITSRLSQNHLLRLPIDFTVQEVSVEYNYTIGLFYYKVTVFTTDPIESIWTNITDLLDEIRLHNPSFDIHGLESRYVGRYVGRYEYELNLAITKVGPKAPNKKSTSKTGKEGAPVAYQINTINDLRAHVERLSRAGYSQEQLANDAGVSQSTISRVIAGDNVRMGTTKKIATALSLPPYNRSVSTRLIDTTCINKYTSPQYEFKHAPTETKPPDPKDIHPADETLLTSDVSKAKYGCDLDIFISIIQTAGSIARAALKSGEMDGSFSIRPQMNAVKLYKAGWSAAGAMRLAFWNRLPPEFRAIMHEGLKAKGVSNDLLSDLEKEHLLDPKETISRILDIPGMFLWIYGPAGCGKTHTVLEILEETEREYIRWQGSPDATPEDLVGGMAAANGSTFFQEGPLPLCVEHGRTLLVDEISACRPDVSFEFHAVLEGKPLVIKADRGRVLYPHDKFRLVATDNGIGDGNAQGYVGTHAMNEAFRDRFVFLQMPYMSAAQEKNILKGVDL